MRTLDLTNEPEIQELLDLVELDELDDAVETRDKIDVVITAVGPAKIAVIKEIRQLTGLGLKATNDLINSVPAVVLKDLDKESAKRANEVLADAGATVELK